MKFYETLMKASIAFMMKAFVAGMLFICFIFNSDTRAVVGVSPSVFRKPFPHLDVV